MLGCKVSNIAESAIDWASSLRARGRGEKGNQSASRKRFRYALFIIFFWIFASTDQLKNRSLVKNYNLLSFREIVNPIQQSPEIKETRTERFYVESPWEQSPAGWKPQTEPILKQRIENPWRILSPVNLHYQSPLQFTTQYQCPSVVAWKLSTLSSNVNPTYV